MIALKRLSFEETDHALVRRFARDQDGEAFSILMGRYADMVYTTCRRILGDEAQAADAVQETFFQLVKNAPRITGSLGSWLHRVATRRAVDIIRQNASRRRREEAYSFENVSEASTWSEVVPVVDEALENLPEGAREILLLHFLQGQTTIQIAAAKAVSQPTISRRLNEALELLRLKLRDQGIHASLVPLQTVLLYSNHAAPEALRSALGKIALAKAATAHTAWLTAASGPAAGPAVKIALAAAAIALTVATTRVARYENERHQSGRSAPVAPSDGPQQNIAGTRSLAPQIGGGPAGQVAPPAPQRASPPTMATATASHLPPPRVGPKNPDTNAPPQTPEPQLTSVPDAPVGNGELGPGQGTASQWPVAVQPLPVWGTYARAYNSGDLFARGDIYKPSPSEQDVSLAWPRYNLNQTVTLGPGAFRNFPSYSPALSAASVQSKVDSGRDRSTRGR